MVAISKRLLFAAITVAVAWAPVAQAQPLRLENPGFEEPAEPGRIPGWGMAQHAGVPAYEMLIDKKAGSGSKQAFRMTRLVHQDFGLLKQRLVLPPESEGKTLKLSALLKVKDVGPEGWLLTVNFESAGTVLLPSGTIKQARSVPLTGTGKWRRVGVETAVPAGAATLDIGVMLLDAGTGWADDFSLAID